MKPIILAINDLDFGGGQRTVVEEANELHRRGHEVYVLTTLKGGKQGLLSELIIDASHIVHIPFRSLVDIPAYRLLIVFLRDTHAKAVVSNLFFTNTVVRFSSLFVYPLKVIVREGNVPTEKSIFVRSIDALLSLRTSVVIGNSECVSKSLGISSIFALKRTLYNGIDKKFFAPADAIDKKKIRDLCAVQENEILLVSVGSLVLKKGFIVLLHAIEGVRGIRVAIVGDGPLRKELENTVRERHLPVSFLGTRLDIPDVLRAGDIFVLPSLWEGMPNALLEALAVGLPSISTDVGGVKEIIKNGENGIVIMPNDALALRHSLVELIGDSVRQKAIGQAARATAETMTWSSHVDGLLAML